VIDSCSKRATSRLSQQDRRAGEDGERVRATSRLEPVGRRAESKGGDAGPSLRTEHHAVHAARQPFADDMQDAAALPVTWTVSTKWFAARVRRA
jgi:hypothetical protein